MINKLKNWYSKLVKCPPIEEKIDDSECDDVCSCCRDCSVEDDDEDSDDTDNTVAYFHIAVSKDNNLLVEGDFRDGHEDDMSKLVFLISAGALSDFVAEIVFDRCDENVKKTNKIMDEAYRMIGEYLKKNEDTEDENPVVDPCDVFNPKNTGEEDDE
jgi:hypothetical protein